MPPLLEDVAMIDTITIRNGSFEAAIVLERLPSMPLANIRKLFKLLLSDYRNEDACRVLEEHMATTVSATKEAWRVASLEYTHGWKLSPSSGKDKRANNTLTTRLKATKAAHTRAAKIQTLYQSLK
ncbi:MAG: hypothetical protein RR403_03220 [Pseudoflavonifractor sp.]